MGRRTSNSHYSFATNCEACGEEHISTDLKQVKLGSWDLKLCKTCRDSDTFNDYRDVVKMLLGEPDSLEEYKEAVEILGKRSTH